jgi:altronate dehydratase
MKPVIQISERDNVATALDALDAGRELPVGNDMVRVLEAIPRGHKIAVRAITMGEAVVKYGSAIGTASADIAAGAHVHTHNVASARGRGDLGQQPPVDAPRIAEPPNDAALPGEPL